MLLPSLRITKPPLSVGAMATYPYDDALARRFTLETRFGEVYSMARRNGAFLELPRAACPLANDQRRAGVAINVKMRIGPRDAEQARVRDEMNVLLSQGESFILQAGTGSGKSFLGCEAICLLGVKTLIVVPKQDLMDQWVSEALVKFTDLKAHDIGIIQADKVSVTGKKVVMAMLHSLAIEDRYAAELLEQFGLVIVDEVHRASADSLSQAFRHIPARVRLGLSATPKRSDGKEQVLYANIGPVRVVSTRTMLTPKVLSFKSSFKVPMVLRRDPVLAGKTQVVQLPHSPGKVAHVVSIMGRDTARNVMIAKLTHMAYSKGRHIVVFTDSLDHVEAILGELRAQGVPPSDLARYIGGMDKNARDNAKQRRIMVATWGMFREGTDVPSLDTAVFATPRSDVVQAAGRILREHPTKREPLIIDIRDDDSRVFTGYYRKRLAWYASISAPVTEH